MPWLPFSDSPRPPVRNNLGTQGKPIRLTANYFPVTMRNPNVEVYQYDVAITEPLSKSPGRIPKAKQMAIFEAMKQQYPKVFGKYAVAFDSEKLAYCVVNIPQMKKGFQYEVELQSESKFTSKYMVTMTIVNSARLRDLIASFKPGALPNQTIFQMLEVMFQHTPSVKYSTGSRNTFYSCDGEFGRSFGLGGGKEAVVGFFSSLKKCAWKDGSLLLNVDIAHTAFYKEQAVLDFMQEDLGFYPNDFHQPLQHGKRKKLLKELKGLKVRVTHSLIPRTYKVIDIGSQGADRQTFVITDPQTNKSTNCTVEKYFYMQYKKKLRFPSLNCLRVAPQTKDIYIPIECCQISKGQKVKKKLGDREVAQMIRTTAKPPFERLQNICKIAKAKDFSNDPLIRSLEFTIADQPMSLDGRVLPAPKLTMNEELVPRQGVWDSRNRSFFQGATLSKWVVMNYETREIRKDTLMKFLVLLKDMGKERGMSFSMPVIRESTQISPEKEFLEIKQRIPDVQMILVILPAYGDVYARVKKIGDREIKVVTQCVRSRNVATNSPQTVANILLKINAKMGGTNNILSAVSQPVVFTKPVMIMGADVNHPPSGDKLTPSLAAVVASLDRYASKYAVEVRHQRGRTEMIQAMKEITMNLMKTFYITTKHKPERIIMFRDGVGDSQFLEVLSYELAAMRAACTELQKDYTPAITFLVVQKRHHTRLFCQERDGVGNSKNIPPGTTVDTTITHPTERDFYLCSHQGIKGTSRPTHYHVLWDDSDLTMDQLQKLTYGMCHLYSRCTRSVSIPAPAYYAHLAAFRAKVHIQDLCMSDSASSSSGEPEVPSDVVMTRACRMGQGDAIYSKMYYV